MYMMIHLIDLPLIYHIDINMIYVCFIPLIYVWYILLIWLFASDIPLIMYLWYTCNMYVLIYLIDLPFVYYYLLLIYFIEIPYDILLVIDIFYIIDLLIHPLFFSGWNKDVNKGKNAKINVDKIDVNHARPKRQIKPTPKILSLQKQKVKIQQSPRKRADKDQPSFDLQIARIEWKLVFNTIFF